MIFSVFPADRTVVAWHLLFTVDTGISVYDQSRCFMFLFLYVLHPYVCNSAHL